MPRVVGTQLHRSNTPAESVLDYYKITIRIPLLDDLMCELDDSFDSSKTEANFNGFANFNGLVQQPEKGHWKEKCPFFANFIKDDLPNALSLELDLEETYWINYEGSLQDNVPSTLKSIRFSGFQNIENALRIISTLPVTSSGC